MRASPDRTGSGPTSCAANADGGGAHAKTANSLVRPANGGRWDHFGAGDRVLVFGEPDPATGWSLVRRGAVTEVHAESISVDFGAAGRSVFTVADRIRISHVAGSCLCVVALP